jgi:hypothetical protein
LRTLSNRDFIVLKIGKLRFQNCEIQIWHVVNCQTKIFLFRKRVKPRSVTLKSAWSRFDYSEAAKQTFHYFENYQSKNDHSKKWLIKIGLFRKLPNEDELFQKLSNQDFTVSKIVKSRFWCLENCQIEIYTVSKIVKSRFQNYYVNTNLANIKLSNKDFLVSKECQTTIYHTEKRMVRFNFSESCQTNVSLFRKLPKQHLPLQKVPG